MPDQIYAAIDLETTGLKSGRDEIIEVGIVRCTPDEVLDTFSSLVRPLEMPGLRVQRLTGIDLDEFAAAPEWHEVEEQVTELLDGATLIGHNIDFDLNFLREAGIRLSTPAVDTLELARIVDPLAPTHRLGDLCERYGITGGEAHRALSDAEAARQVFLELRKRFDDLPMDARLDLAEVVFASDAFWTTGRVLADWIGQTRLKQGASMPRRERFPSLRPVELPQGSLVQLTDQVFDEAEKGCYERREEQRAMARDVAQSLQYGGALVVEAGTGTGKSLAYLIPATLWALKTGKTVLISTHTKNLQEQLAAKEIEKVRELIGAVAPRAAEAIRSTVVKGRGNYLCQDHLDKSIERCEGQASPLLARLAVWRNLTQTGDEVELRLPPDDAADWPGFSAAHTWCMSDTRNHHNAVGSCFLRQVQSRAANSHIVTVNHYLLAAAVARGSALVPNAPVVIIDEAHAFEDAATGQLTDARNEPWIMDAVVNLTDKFDELREIAAEGPPNVVSDEPLNSAQRAEVKLADVFDRIAEFITLYRERDGSQEHRVVLTAGTRQFREWSELEEVWVSVREELSSLTNGLDALLRAIVAAEPEEGESEEVLRAVNTVDRQLTELQQRMISMEDVITKHDKETVAWVERDGRKSENIALHTSPLSVGPVMSKLWSESHAAVITSATLPAGGGRGKGFRFTRERLGIEDASEAQYGSPFDYKRNARIYLPTDSPGANQKGHDEYVASAVKRLAIVAGGRTMGLFRSYSAMRRVVDEIKGDLADAGLTLLVQGRDGSARDLERMLLHGDPRSVVFGVSALWTGVDVPGDSLSLLIVTRLPFVVPTDPVRKARANEYDDAFSEYTVPTAVLEFRQGIGRLIRRSTDKGALVVLDGRIRNKWYGSEFRDALFPAPVKELPLMQVVAEVKRFLPPPERAP